MHLLSRFYSYTFPAIFVREVVFMSVIVIFLALCSSGLREEIILPGSDGVSGPALMLAPVFYCWLSLGWSMFVALRRGLTERRQIRFLSIMSIITLICTAITSYGILASMLLVALFRDTYTPLFTVLIWLVPAMVIFLFSYVICLIVKLRRMKGSLDKKKTESHKNP